MNQRHDIELSNCGLRLLEWIERQYASAEGVPQMPDKLWDIAVALLERAAGTRPGCGSCRGRLETDGCSCCPQNGQRITHEEGHS